LLARASETFLRLYHNVNYDSDANGERRVLDRLGPGQLACVFDVGANIGDWVQLARRASPAAAIHAFEIVPSTFESLRRRVGSDLRTTLNPVGLSDTSGTIDVFHCPDDPGLSSIFPYPTGKAVVSVRGETVTGDAYCAERGITHIDFLKIDVEGHELSVLRGFDRLLANGQVDVVQFEYGYVNILPKSLLKDLYEFLENRGYAVGKIFPTYVDFRHYDLHDEDFLGPNYLAVHRDRRDAIARVS
jgi:FkbM family methyltransferase